MTNPEELRRKFGRRTNRLWLAAAGLALALAVAGLPAARPAWRALKSWRADQFLAEADGLLAEQQISLAFERARSALQLMPQRADVLRLNARLLGRIGSETSLTLWQRLLDSGQASPDDVASFVDTALGFERPDLVAGIVSGWSAELAKADRTCRLAALYYLQTGNPSAAIREARQACRLEVSNPTNSMLLASLLIAGTNASARAEARNLFWSVARTNGPLELVALQCLANAGDTERRDREEVCGILSARTNRSPAEDVLLAETRMQLEPQRISEIASNLVAGLPRDDWPQWTRIVEALERRGRHAEVLALTGVGRSLLNRQMFLARYEALLATGRPDEAYRHLLVREAPLPPFDLALARVRGAQDAGDLKRRDVHLKELLQVAGDHPVRVRRAAQLAEAANSREALAVAMDGWKQLSERPGEAANALRHLQRLADRLGDTWTARDYARRALRISATDETRLDIAYYDLLLGENLDPALAEAERQLAARTDDFFVRAVAALAHLRLGSPQQARAVLDRFIISEANLRTNALAVVVATYGANGLESQARDLAAHVTVSALRPEERDLIRPWLMPPPLGAPAVLPH